MTLAELKKSHIFSTLESCKGNKTQAAKILGIRRTTLHRMLKSYEPRVT